jgi:hypothetical protein
MPGIKSISVVAVSSSPPSNPSFLSCTEKSDSQATLVLVAVFYRRPGVVINGGRVGTVRPVEVVSHVSWSGMDCPSWLVN